MGKSWFRLFCCCKPGKENSISLSNPVSYQTFPNSASTVPEGDSLVKDDSLAYLSDEERGGPLLRRKREKDAERKKEEEAKKREEDKLFKQFQQHITAYLEQKKRKTQIIRTYSLSMFTKEFYENLRRLYKDQEFGLNMANDIFRVNNRLAKIYYDLIAVEQLEKTGGEHMQITDHIKTEIGNVINLLYTQHKQFEKQITTETAQQHFPFLYRFLSENRFLSAEVFETVSLK